MLSVERLQDGEAFGAGGPVQHEIERGEGEGLPAGVLASCEGRRELDGVESTEAVLEGKIGARPQKAPGPMYGSRSAPTSS